MKNLFFLLMTIIAISCANEKQEVEDSVAEVETTTINSDESTTNSIASDNQLVKIYKTNEVDQLPIFGKDCVDEDNKWDCTVKSVQRFIDDNIEYPESAARKGGESLEKVTFVVLPDGTLGKKKYVTSKGYDCDGCQKAAVEAVGKMTDWIPAKKDGQPVSIELTIPVRFAMI